MFGSITSAETFGYGRTESVPINYSLIPTVNNTEHFNGYSVATLWTFYSGLGDALWCELTGCTISGNVTANWFKGQFNWTTGDTWNSFDGSTLTFNETLLNSTIEAKIASVEYNASVITTIDGTNDGGNLFSTQILGDNDAYNVSEASGADPLTIVINFTGVENFNIIQMREWYQGGSGHTIEVGVYICDGGGYDSHGVLSDMEEYGVTQVNEYVPSDHICGVDQNVSVRLYHSDNGIPSHDFSLESIHLIQGASVSSPTEVDPLSIHKTGDVALTGDWNYGAFGINGSGNFTTTGNVSASYFFGNGSQLTGINTGNPFNQNLNTTDDVLFNNLNTSGSVTFGKDLGQVDPPTGFSFAATGGSGGYNNPPMGGLNINLYSYRDDPDGRVYSTSTSYGAALPAGQSYLTWTFTPGANADGYLATFNDFAGHFGAAGLTYYRDDITGSPFDDQGIWTLTPPPTLTQYSPVGTHVVNGASLTVNTPTTLTAALIGTLITGTSLKSPGLTSGRVTYATTGGLLKDDADLTFSGTKLTIGSGAAGVDYNFLGVNGETNDLSLTWLEDEAILKSSLGGLWFDGTADTTPTSGAGTRLMWIPSKVAFRAGKVTGTQWDDANIGQGSFAVGENNICTGQYSACFGDDNNVTSGATKSNAFGYANKVSTLYSNAFGTAHNITGSGYSVAFGGNNKITGTASMAGGFFGNVGGFGAFANGVNWNSDYTSFIAGVGDDSGSGTIAMGVISGATKTLIANASGAIAMGEDVNALNYNTISLGKDFSNYIASSFAVGFGQKNLFVSDTDAYVNVSNVLTIYNNTGLGTIRYGSAVTSTTINTDEDVLETYKLGDELYYPNGNVNHQAFGECYEQIPYADKTKPLITVVKNTIVVPEFIFTIENINKTKYPNWELLETENRSGIIFNTIKYDKEEITFPEKIYEDGVDLTCQEAKNTQALALINRNIDLYPNLTDFDTGIMAENIYTQSKVPQPNINYMKRFFDRASLWTKATHYAYTILTNEDIPEDKRGVLSVEDRIVEIEGALSQMAVETCAESNNKYTWCNIDCQENEYWGSKNKKCEVIVE